MANPANYESDRRGHSITVMDLADILSKHSELLDEDQQIEVVQLVLDFIKLRESRVPDRLPEWLN